ncbi:MAG TPA: thymidine kinase [Armatimonadota bacterium]|jgi:thymidine kinase
MDLTLILGPMKSGKSFDLISHFAPLQYTDISFGLFQSARNQRDASIFSRTGSSLAATKLSSLAPLLEQQYEIIGIDEVHMFAPEEAEIVNTLINRGVQVVASGLDMDYRGKLMPTIQRLLELGPAVVRYRRAVCEVCRRPNATHTQVYRGTQPLVEGAPPVLPEDGTYVYKPVCRQCFVQKSLGFMLFEDASAEEGASPPSAGLGAATLTFGSRSG